MSNNPRIPLSEEDPTLLQRCLDILKKIVRQVTTFKHQKITTQQRAQNEAEIDNLLKDS